MSKKHSPKKISQSFSTESLDLAKQIFERKRDLSTLEQSEQQICLRGLQALRHRSMIDHDKRKMQKCDSLILELNNIIKSYAKDSSSVKSSSSNSINFSSSGNINMRSSSGYSSPIHSKQVDISEDEMNQIESIIDSLLKGSEIDFVDSESLPKLEAVLKMRKAKAVQESNYKAAKILEKNIQSLSKYRHQTKTSSPSKQKEFIAELEKKIKELNEKLIKLKENFVEEKERIKTDREESLNSLFAQNEKEVNDLLEEKTDIMMGIGFKPSKKLIELRQQEASLAKLSLFDEASMMKKEAEELEITERREFDRKRTRNFDIKEKEQRKKLNAKIKTTEEYWDNLLERTENRFVSEIELKQKEIDKIIAKIESVTGQKYNSINNDTFSDVSGLSFNDNYPSNKSNNELNNSNFAQNKLNDNDSNFVQNELNDNDSNFAQNKLNDNDSNFVQNELNDNDSNFVQNELNDNDSNFVQNELNDNDSNFAQNKLNDSNIVQNELNDNDSNFAQNKLNDNNYGDISDFNNENNQHTKSNDDILDDIIINDDNDILDDSIKSDDTDIIDEIIKNDDNSE